MLKSTPAQDSYYKISQSFGERNLLSQNKEDDLLTALAFDKSGEQIAVGDNAGRLVLFKFTHPNFPDDNIVGSSHNLHYKRISSFDLGNLLLKNGSEYEYLFDFQSHLTEFDPLKSEVIEQKIENISFLNNNGNQINLISSNSKTIKLWRVSEKHQKIITSNNKINENKSNESLSRFNLLSPCIMKLKSQKGPININNRDFNDFSDSINEIEIMNCVRSFHDEIANDLCTTPISDETVYLPKMIVEYPKLHRYAINSIKVFKNDTLMLSSDDLKIYLWHINKPLIAFAIIDKTPFDLDEVNEVITCSELSRSSDNLFIFGTSKGTVNMCDLRIRATDCITNAYCSRIRHNWSFEEVLGSISDCQFNKDDNFIVARDYLTIKIWDVRMGKHVYKELEIFEPIKDILV
jgi:serine/threonine-protein phosphatase 2A regulatory subunit B